MARLPCLRHQAVLRRDPLRRPDLRRHRRGADARPRAARLRGHRLRPVQQGRGHLGHLPRPLRQRDRPARHPQRRFGAARQAARLPRSRRPSRPRTGASTTTSASTSSARSARSVEQPQATAATQGGSSITQQLAKNLFLSSERTLERKIKEAFLAVWLEWHYTKDEILKLYFDRAYMGGGNFGVAAASEFYFGKKVTDVNLAEAAMLAGLFKAPTKYAPHVDLAAARGRANLVLTNLVDAGFLTEGQVTAARRNPAIADRPLDRGQLAQLLPRLGVRGGQDASSQTRASAPTASSSAPPSIRCCRPTPRTPSPRSSASRASSTTSARRRWSSPSPNGAIRAMVGGIDYGKSQFNRAIVPNRQPGSVVQALRLRRRVRADPGL